MKAIVFISFWFGFLRSIYSCVYQRISNLLYRPNATISRQRHLLCLYFRTNCSALRSSQHHTFCFMIVYSNRFGAVWLCVIKDAVLACLKAWAWDLSIEKGTCRSLKNCLDVRASGTHDAVIMQGGMCDLLTTLCDSKLFRGNTTTPIAIHDGDKVYFCAFESVLCKLIAIANTF